MSRAGDRKSSLALFAVFLVMTCLDSLPAAAAEIPISARSKALLYPVSLLDQSTLVFRFPQLVTRYESQLLMMSDGYWSTDLVGGGALGRSGRHGVFVLVQDRDPWMKIGQGYQLSGLSSRFFQGGFGSAWGDYRAGLAIRGSMEGSEESGSALDTDSERREQAYSRYRDDLLELGAGFGWGNDRTMVDLTLEVAGLDQSGVDHTLRHNEHEPDDYWYFSFEREREPILTAAVRARLPLGSKGEALFAGFWGEDRTVWTGRARTDSDTLITVTPYADNWGADLSIAGAASKLDWLALSASYRSFRSAYLVGESGEIDFGAYTHRTAYGAISLRQRIVNRVEGYAGVRGAYQFARTESWSQDWLDEYARASGRATEDLGGEASWGASYEWRNVRLMGRLTTTLEISRPFLALDLAVLL
jgi:hypothetical protein